MGKICPFFHPKMQNLFGRFFPKSQNLLKFHPKKASLFLAFADIILAMKRV